MPALAAAAAVRGYEKGRWQTPPAIPGEKGENLQPSLSRKKKAETSNRRIQTLSVTYSDIGYSDTVRDPLHSVTLSQITN